MRERKCLCAAILHEQNWFNRREPVEPASRLVVCVDYSVANEGLLVAYRFDGESELSRAKFVVV
jgi:hypothetical protein